MIDQTLEFEQREFLIWLRGVERRAILPLKWAIFFTSLVFWILSHPHFWPPPVDVFTLFTVYFMYNLGESYFFGLNRVELHQVRPFCYTSYIVDVLFVTVLIYFDASKYPAVDGPATDFYIFYFLLILRGFALFRTPRENLMANSIIGAVFILTMLWQETSGFSYSSRNNLIRVVFVWLVILMSWYIVEIINRQKEEIMRARENLIRSENLAILGELAAGVAHEINNPIGIISAYAEFLAKNAKPDDPRMDDFQAMHTEAQRCKEIVGELLNYARPHARETVMADLRDLNNEVVEFLFRRRGRDEVEVVKDYAEDLPKIKLDPNKFKQALLNILMNARQALSETGGRIEISLKRDVERNGLRMRVSDNGKGIAPDELRRVFDPFFTTRNTGTGLGLSITRRIVESQGGSISIESQLGQGTTVDLFLPVSGA
ncbi:MAG: ATP-binding protein [Candidatus Sumerlaeaceae bacterium]|nr:ATP-binding protein [Candidatus Sumerlaeaceae bacterium]